MKTTFTKLAISAAVSSLLALSVTGCHESTDYVKCYGVSKQGGDAWIGMTAGQCKKLAGAKAVPATPDEAKTIVKYTPEDYIKCYGVAAGSMNDCGTKTTSCGGTVPTPRQADAWIAIPRGLCAQIKGGVIEEPKEAE